MKNKIMNIIRKFMSHISIPKEPIYVCSAGDHWISSYYYLGRHDFSYQRIKQNTWGWWKIETCWLGTNEELSRCSCYV